MRNCFFNLNLHVIVLLHFRCSNVSSTSARIFLFYYISDAQMFLQPQLAPYSFITCSMLKCFFNLISYLIVLLRFRCSIVFSVWERIPWNQCVLTHSRKHSFTHWTIRKNFHRCWWRGRSVFYSLSTFVFPSTFLWPTWTNPKRLSLAQNIVTNFRVNGMAGWWMGRCKELQWRWWEGTLAEDCCRGFRSMGLLSVALV